MAKSTQKVKLNQSDWDALFPETPFIIGSTELLLVPLSLAQVAQLMKKLAMIKDKSAFDFQRLRPSDTGSVTVETIIEFVAFLLEQAPDILSDLSGLDVEDVKALPVNIVVDLAIACVNLNIASYEGLLKNLTGLGEKVVQLTSHLSA